MTPTDRVAAALGRLSPQELRVDLVATSAVTPGTPLAATLRGALGAAVHDDPALKPFGWADDGQPSLWFRGWHGPALAAGDRLTASLVVLAPVVPFMERLTAALDRLEILGVALRLVAVTPVADTEAPMPGTAVEVEARSPVALRAGGIFLTGAPPLAVLVRSAGERLRQLDVRWGAADAALPTAVGVAVRQSDQVDADVVAVRTEHALRVGRRARHRVGGVVGRWRYPAASPAVNVLLAAAARLGVGKGVAFGCGWISVREAG